MSQMVRVRDVYKPGNADFWEKQYSLYNKNEEGKMKKEK